VQEFVSFSCEEDVKDRNANLDILLTWRKREIKDPMEVTDHLQLLREKLANFL